MAKQCKKGKSCGGTCIASDKICRLDLNESVSVASGKVAKIVQKKQGQGEAGEKPKKKVTPKKKETPATTASPKTASTGGTSNELETQRERLKTEEGKKEVKAETEMEYRRLLDFQADEPREKDISVKAHNTISNYTRGAAPGDLTGYRQMNNCSRNPPTCAPETEKANKELDTALKSAPRNTKGGALYRGINLNNNPALAEQFANLKPGDTLTDAGFGSYSRDLYTARSFLKGKNDPQSRNVMFITRNKNIRFIEEYSSMPFEQEGILPRNTPQTVRSVKHIGNVTYIEVD